VVQRSTCTCTFSNRHGRADRGEGRGVREREDETRQTSEEQKQRGGDVFLINSRFYVLNSLYIIILNKT
jgi:hypothetical protein